MNKKFMTIITGVLVTGLLGCSISSACGNVSAFRLINTKNKIVKVVSPKNVPQKEKYNEFDVNKDGVVDVKDQYETKDAIFILKKYDSKYDFNKDKVLDEKDYQMLLDYICKTVTPAPTPVKPGSEFDVNKDGVVDGKDQYETKNAIFALQKYDPKYDFNKDKVLDEKDYQMISDYISKTVTPAPTPQILKYDLNKDGKQDVKDMEMVSDALGLFCVYDFDGSGYFDEKDYELLWKDLSLKYDFNKDGIVDDNDAGIIKNALALGYTYDFNKDGKFNKNDYYYIMSCIPVSGKLVQ